MNTPALSNRCHFLIPATLGACVATGALLMAPGLVLALGIIKSVGLILAAFLICGKMASCCLAKKEKKVSINFQPMNQKHIIDVVVYDWRGPKKRIPKSNPKLIDVTVSDQAVRSQEFQKNESTQSESRKAEASQVQEPQKPPKLSSPTTTQNAETTALTSEVACIDLVISSYQPNTEPTECSPSNAETPLTIPNFPADITPKIGSVPPNLDDDVPLFERAPSLQRQPSFKKTIPQVTATASSTFTTVSTQIDDVLKAPSLQRQPSIKKIVPQIVATATSTFTTASTQKKEQDVKQTNDVVDDVESGSDDDDVQIVQNKTLRQWISDYEAQEKSFAVLSKCFFGLNKPILDSFWETFEKRFSKLTDSYEEARSKMDGEGNRPFVTIVDKATAAFKLLLKSFKPSKEQNSFELFADKDQVIPVIEYIKPYHGVKKVTVKLSAKKDAKVSFQVKDGKHTMRLSGLNLNINVELLEIDIKANVAMKEICFDTKTKKLSIIPEANEQTLAKEVADSMSTLFFRQGAAIEMLKETTKEGEKTIINFAKLFFHLKMKTMEGRDVNLDDICPLTQLTHLDGPKKEIFTVTRGDIESKGGASGWIAAKTKEGGIKVAANFLRPFTPSNITYDLGAKVFKLTSKKENLPASTIATMTKK